MAEGQGYHQGWQTSATCRVHCARKELIESGMNTYSQIFMSPFQYKAELRILATTYTYTWIWLYISVFACICLRWFFYSKYHGKSSFFTTIWLKIFGAFPSILSKSKYTHVLFVRQDTKPPPPGSSGDRTQPKALKVAMRSMAFRGMRSKQRRW